MAKYYNIPPGRILICQLALLLSVSVWASLSLAETMSDRCRERLLSIERSVGISIVGLGAIRETVRVAELKTRSREAILENLGLHPPEDYDERLAVTISRLRRRYIRPKHHLLSQLRNRHDEGRREWEKKVRSARRRYVDATAELREMLPVTRGNCEIREAYADALQEYREALERYKVGLGLYAEALDAYREQFVNPSIRGYEDPAIWSALAKRVERGMFLERILDLLSTSARRAAPETES